MTGEEYFKAYKEAGSYREAARRLDCHESTVRRAAQRYAARIASDPALQAGMSHLGMEKSPTGGWVKSHEPDELGRTYSMYIRGEPEEAEEREAQLDRIKDLFQSIPAVKLQTPPSGVESGLVGLLPLNDIHAGAYAWSDETGYGDWDIDIATERLTSWSGSLIDTMPRCNDCILLYNGDTLHANDGRAVTPTSGHILDVDTRPHKVIDATTLAMIVTADQAAQKHDHVRIVVKKGNHDPEAYIGLLQGLKWRYADQPNVTVENDPSPYWSHQFGKVFLFAHHGNGIQAKDLVLKAVRDQKLLAGRSDYCYGWTAHLHKNERVTVHDVKVERASCITEPDAYGAKWGTTAEMLAVIYHPDRGEVERYTRRNWAE